MGLHTADAVRAFRADVLFMSTTAVTNGRCYHTSPETVQVKRAMMERAAPAEQVRAVRAAGTEVMVVPARDQ
ncbi:hypothetical protein [Streptomyces sp. NPDC057302]|uniref:hypothetical protein n=1 Tax=Streptomyces sp. NPDC057302 TaxID=3346094 RepID=UPI00362DE69F